MNVRISTVLTRNTQSNNPRVHLSHVFQVNHIRGLGDRRIERWRVAEVKGMVVAVTETKGVVAVVAEAKGVVAVCITKGVMAGLCS